MLIAFPVALYVATVVALFVFLGSGNPFWYRVAFYSNVAGVVMAVIAAVPGLIDLLNLPRHSRPRMTGVRHAALNSLSLVLFAVSAALLYRNMVTLDVTAPLVLGVVGLASTVTAGWLGWTLVQTHHVGVQDHEIDAAHVPRDQLQTDVHASAQPRDSFRSSLPY
jgi:uncharacterized membrane protein